VHLPQAARVVGVAERTLYRRVTRGQVRSRRTEQGRIEVWVEHVAEPCSTDDGQDRAVLLVDRVSTAVMRQVEALAVELAASRERIESLARENGALEREVMHVRHVSDSTQARLQAELDQARARIAELERPPAPAPNAAPWWHRWWLRLAGAGLGLTAAGTLAAAGWASSV